MGQLPDWIGNFPFPPDKKKPIVITRSRTKQFIYPDKPENSDFNWNYASTDCFFIAQYQLSPGVQFLPADVHTGDEVYYVVEGTLTMLNPETGEVHQVEENEGFLIPLGGWHQGFNFTNKQTRMFLIIAPTIWPPKGLPEEGFPGDTKIFSFNSQPNPNPKTQPVRIPGDPKTPDLIGRWPIPGSQARKKPVNSMLISEKDKLQVIWGREHPVLLKFLVSNDLVHMAELYIPAGGLSPRSSEAHAHQGDEATYVCEGDLCVFFPDTKEAMEVRPEEVIYIPQGVKHQYINYSDQVVKAVKAVAPCL
ncbi:MAG: cupin domain-containing protein [Desulfobacterales bacterium]|nr:cupin domain-containing protein [Desulfobacterales bacterium]